MTNIINKHTFTNNPNQKFISDKYEMTGKFTNIDFDLSDSSKLDKLLQRNKLNRLIKVNKPVKTKGTYLINGVEYPVNLGSVVPLDDKAVSKLRQQATSKHNDFNCVIEPNTSIHFKGDIALQGRVSNGHYVTMNQARHKDMFYNQIKDIELDPNGPTKSLAEIDENKPVQLRGKIEIYDRSKVHANKKPLSYGTYPIKLGTITPQDYRAADSLTDALENHDLNLIVDKTSDVKFTGEHVPTGVVTNNSHVVLDEEARMDKVLIGDNSTIDLACGRLKNSVLLGTNVKDVFSIGNSEVVDSIIDARIKNNHDKHTLLQMHSDNEHNFHIINSKIVGPSSLISSWVENSNLYSQSHNHVSKSKKQGYEGLYDYSSIENSTLVRTDAIKSFITNSKLLGSHAGIVTNETTLNQTTLNNVAAVLDNSNVYDLFINKDLTCENSILQLNRYSKYNKVVINTPLDAKDLNIDLGFQNGTKGMAYILSKRNGYLSYSQADSDFINNDSSKVPNFQYDLSCELSNKLYQVPQTEVELMLKSQDKYGHVSSKVIDELDQHAKGLYNQSAEHKSKTSVKTKDEESWEL